MIHHRLIAEDIKMALETIRTHKVRSFLTVLGVVIGVSVAIAVTSILLGVEKNVQDSLNEFGVDNLFVTRFDPGIHIGRFSPEERSRKPLTFEDGISEPGKYVEMRAETDVLALISNCPQLNNPCNGYDPTPVEVLIWDGPVS